jgi:hypothetical protein
MSPDIRCGFLEHQGGKHTRNYSGDQLICGTDMRVSPDRRDGVRQAFSYLLGSPILGLDVSETLTEVPKAPFEVENLVVA